MKKYTVLDGHKLSYNKIMEPTHIKESSDRCDKKWDKTFRLGNMHIRIGHKINSGTSSFFIEKTIRKGDYIFLRQHIFQKIYNEGKVRLAHHSRKKILKKVISGQ